MKLNTKILSLVLGFISLFASSLTVANDSSITGAACVIRSGEKIVLVKEILTNKLSLPAGGVAKGESPEAAAQRETWEETGLVVSIKGELGRSDKTVFYNCVSDSDIVSFQFNNRFDGYELPIWFAPHYGIEVSSAMLIDPAAVPREEYRFPKQLDWLEQILPQASDQKAVFVGNLTQAAPKFHQVELNWITQLQHLFLKLPSELVRIVEPLLLAGNWLSEPSLILVLFPLLYWRFGKELSYKVFFAVTMTSLFSLVAQQGFAFPRPHVYLPALDLAKSYGFSLPSLPIAVWSCVGVLVLSASEKLSINRWSMSLLVILFWLSLANFYSGSAFLIDSVSGALLGMLCAWHLVRLESKPEVDSNALMTSKSVWIILLAVCALMTLFWPTPIFTYWLAVILAVLGLVVTLKRDANMASGRALVLICAGMVVTNGIVSMIAVQVSTSSIASLSVETLRYPILICLFVISVRKLAKAD
ncbi:bifunctional NUDIX hydrolase/phosphatase PAP2 family protein [Vibrio sp. VPAP30]|uniref:bifunctional NUDIX hydrolase/phosphatase PAP2 family protein n=1 Tax=Vibrio sp. VPAP30 TaxID=1647102 RepID=UPI00065A4D27|nr:NUDIX domain-containing protein [Vibrio sp. VPAP30]KLN65837.1 DNA mismatch repair protein MutT [Vibrio sp. VPAP30]